MSSRSASPFDCRACTDRDRRNRNCHNASGLSDEARAVEEYSDEVREEIAGKKAAKVFTLGTLRLYECPLSYLTDETMEVMRVVYLMDSTGRLLYDGELAGQPYWLVQAYEIYKSESILRRKGEDDV